MQSLRAQLAQLSRFARRAPQHTALWQARGKALSEYAHSHLGGMGPPKPSGRVKFLRGCLMPLLHPASYIFANKPTLADQKIARLQSGCGAQRCHTFSSEGHLLDALLLQPQAAGTAHRSRPLALLLVVVGFAMTYETIVDEAQKLADTFGMQVLLYNSRGIGKSLGTPGHTGQMILDSEAAILLAQRISSRIGVYGLSFGAATSLFALQQLGARGALLNDCVALYASIRSFSCLADVAQAHLPAGSAAWINRALQAAELHPLRSAEAMRAPLPAQHILVATAAADRLVPAGAQLGPLLQLARNAQGSLPSGQRATHAFGVGQGHNDRSLSHPLHDKLLHLFAQPVLQ